MYAASSTLESLRLQSVPQSSNVLFSLHHRSRSELSPTGIKYHLGIVILILSKQTGETTSSADLLTLESKTIAHQRSFQTNIHPTELGSNAKSQSMIDNKKPLHQSTLLLTSISGRYPVLNGAPALLWNLHPLLDNYSSTFTATADWTY
eukprot:scaffold10063_cov79-Skeletonema_marinoi.AAC.2